MLAGMWQERIKRASVSFGMLARMRQERMKTTSVSFGVLAGVWQERIKRASVTFRMLARMRQGRIKRASVSLGMLAMMRQEHMKTASVSLGVLAGVWQERVKRASVTIRMLQQPRRSGLRVLQQGARIPAAEQLASAGAAATALWRLICGATESPKKPFPDLGPLQLVDLGWQAKANGCGGSGPKAHAIGYVGHKGLGEPGDRSYISVPNSGPFSAPKFGTTKAPP